MRYLILLVSLISLSASGSNTFSHSAWDRVLNRFVDETGFVDYQALSEQRTDLDDYLSRIKSTGPRTEPELFATREDELAYYINAYNAMVFKGVLERGPERKSVWRGLISGLNFFVLMDITIDGEKTNLKAFEDKVIRGQFMDPRIHAAINCASVSCPRLRKTAFVGARLNQQLDDAFREFVAEDRNVKQVGSTLYLSKIFKWFEEDFLINQQANSSESALIHYINRYRDEESKLSAGAAIKYFKYDKRINQQNRS